MADLDPAEEIARMKAEIDQAKEGLKELASVLWMFHAELLTQGFTSPDAMRLTVAWLTALLTGGSQGLADD